MLDGPFHGVGDRKKSPCDIERGMYQSFCNPPWVRDISLLISLVPH